MKLRAGMFFGLAGLLVAMGLARDGLDAWVAHTKMPPLNVETSTEIRDRGGQLLRAYTVEDGRWRLAVTPGEVDPDFIRMLIAYEDKRYYAHAGVDMRAFLRALWQAARSGHIVSGGSTLTMQVARLLEDGPTGSIEGKIRQIRLALALERRLGKDEILALYLNRAPYGGNLEGIRAATLAYLGKEPRRLTEAESALLVALPQSPSQRRPDLAPGTARAARDKVLARAVGAQVISAEAAAAARSDPVPSMRRDFPALAPHLADRSVRERPALGRHDLTIDARLQSQLERLATRAARDHGARLSVAILVADHETGEILASVGSAGYRADARQGFVDMTRALRSPGSTLKPLVYALAFDEGLGHPETLIEDRPMRFGPYAPENFDGAYRGTMKMRDALVQSRNIPVVALTEALGPASLMAAMRRAGMQPQLPGDSAPGLAIALGGIGVTLDDLVRLYSALAHGGTAVSLHTRLADAAAAGARARVVSPEAAWLVADTLRGMPAPGNAPHNRLAYKTGTSYGHRDTWAIGFDGRHVIGVWMGQADGAPVPGAFGAGLAAPILFEAFARLKPELDRLAPPPPATLVVSHGALPEQLKRFQPRGAVFAGPEAPELAFPPDGSVVETGGAPLVARVESGRAPFTWLANGAPVLVGSTAREAELALTGPGFVTLSVIDADGRAARAQFRLN